MIPWPPLRCLSRYSKGSGGILSDTLGSSLKCRFLPHPTIKDPEIVRGKVELSACASPMASSIRTLSRHLLSRTVQYFTSYSALRVSLCQKFAQDSSVQFPITNYCRPEVRAYSNRTGITNAKCFVWVLEVLSRYCFGTH
jgi:hypothetical protein